jgi:replicative DNA helicase
MKKEKNSLENRIDILLNEKIQTTFLNSGFPKLDELIGEFSSSDFIVIGGRPMMGKTAFMISLALNFSIKNRVLFLNLDTPEENISNRFLANITGIPYSNLKTKNLNEGQLFTLEKSKNELLNYNLQVESKLFDNADFLLESIRNHIEINDTKVIFIDTLPTIVDSVFYAEYNSYSAKLNHELKKIAKELDVCIICSCELSRDIELRGGDKRPMIADLLSCQNLEEVTDKIIFIYRPEHYGLTEDMHGESTIDNVELIVAKSDIGCDETLIFKQYKNFTKFY